MVLEKIIILGGGASAANHDLKNLHNKGFVIGVNDAAMQKDVKVNAVVTMDRTWFENRFERVKKMDLPFYARSEAVINIKDRWPKLHIFICNRESNHMTRNVGYLNGLNSGFCALNLAFQVKPRMVVALGFDCKRTGYWYKPYEWQQQGPNQRGITSDWAFDKWQKGLAEIKQQFLGAGIELKIC